MRVDLRRGHVLVAQQLLHRADVVTRLDQVRREGVPQRVGRGRFVDTGAAHRSLHRALHALLEEVMAALYAA